MSNLLFLTADDFELRKGSKGNIVCHDIPGYSLVLFYSTQCKYCKELIPIFKQLPGSISGCQFGMINVSKNKNIVHMSRNSIAPIEYVPYVILFINGKPSMRYDGPADIYTIQKFVIDVSKRFKGQNFNRKNEQNSNDSNSQINNQVNIRQHSKRIPEYCIGQPLCGDDNKCYLEFDTAYVK
jgi:thioredoxin-like negative regulator of GroEL